MNAPRTTTKRVAIYTRKSVARGLEQDFNSLDAQRDHCERFAEMRSFDGWTVLTDRYDDGGFTGANLDRPAFQRLMTDARAGRIDIVLAYRLDRISRSARDFVNLHESLRDHGVELVLVTENFDTTTPMGRAMLKIAMVFAELERETTSQRTKEKIHAARLRGRWTGGPIPYGYDSENARLVTNEAEAATIRVLFDSYLSTRSARATAKALNDAGHRRRKGKTWTKAAVLSRLKDPLVRGLIRAGDDLVEAEHEAIIDASTAAQVDELLAQHRRPAERVSRNAEYLLAGLVTCASCGGSYTPSSARSRGRRYRYYRCVTRDKVGKHACEARPLPAPAVEDFVVEQVRGLASEPEMVESVVTDLHARIARERASLRTEQAALPATVGQHHDAVSGLVDTLEGLSGPARAVVEDRLNTAAQAQQQAQERLVEVERRLLLLDGAEADAEWVEQALAHFSELWEVMTPENRGRLLRALVRGVRVDSSTGDIAVELHDLGEPMGEAAR